MNEKTLNKKVENKAKKTANFFKKAEAACNSLGLQFTFRSVEFMLDIEGITFGQLRVAQFYSENGIQYNPEKAVKLLVKAGLIGSKQCSSENLEELDNKTYEILESWMKKIGSLDILYILLIKQLEERHFFTLSADLETLLEKDLKNSIKSIMAALIQMRIQELHQITQNTGKIIREMHIKNFIITPKLL